MREEISILAGARLWGDTRESWLSRVPKAVKRALGTDGETVTYRMVKSLWYGAIKNPEHHAARDVRRAANIVKAKKEAAELATKFQNIAENMRAAHHDGRQDLFSAEIDRLERVARLLGGLDRGA